MKTAIFPSAFYPSLGGVEELVRQLAQQFKRDGHSVLIATNRYPKTLAEREDVEGLDVRRYVCRVPEHTWKQMGGAVLCGPGTLRQVVADLGDFQAEIVHVECVSSPAYYALRAAKRLRVPFVVTLQGELTMDASRVFQRSKFAQKMMRDVLKHADAVTGCSAHTLKEGEEFYGQPFGKKGFVVPNGVRCKDFESTPYAHPRPYIFALGRHAAQKGFDNLLKAFARIVKDPRSAELHDLLLAGDGPERSQLEALATELGLGDRVKFVGRQNHDDTVKLFLGCSFFVLSSRAHEGLPVVSVEALAAGVPIVATDSGGTAEAVQNGINGLIIPRDDVDALEASMLRMASEPELRAAMRHANPIRAQKYDWSNVAAEYMDVYEYAAQTCRARRQ